MAQLSYTGQQLDQAIKKVRADADIYTILNGTKFGTGTAASYSITTSASHLTVDPSNPVQIYEDSSVTLYFTADGVNYKTPTSVSVTNASAIFVRTSNTKCSVVISNPTGNVSVSISGVVLVKTTFTISGTETATLACETGMTWNTFRTSGMPGSEYITISGTDVYYKTDKLFTNSTYTTAVTASSVITATTYYGTDPSLILTGTWLFAEEIVGTSEPGEPFVFTENVTFTSNGVTYTSMSSDDNDLYYGATKTYSWVDPEHIGWVSETYRTVTFSNSVVSSSFKTFIVRNAIQL